MCRQFGWGGRPGGAWGSHQRGRRFLCGQIFHREQSRVDLGLPRCSSCEVVQVGHTISGGHVVATGASLVLTDGIEAVGEFRCKPTRICSVGGVKQAPSSGSVEAFDLFTFLPNESGLVRFCSTSSLDRFERGTQSTSLRVDAARDEAQPFSLASWQTNSRID